MAAALRQTSKIRRGNIDLWMRIRSVEQNALTAVHDALEKLTKAIREVEAVVETIVLSTTRWPHTFSSLAATTRTYPIQRAGSGAG